MDLEARGFSGPRVPKAPGVGQSSAGQSWTHHTSHCVPFSGLQATNDVLTPENQQPRWWESLGQRGGGKGTEGTLPMQADRWSPA